MRFANHLVNVNEFAHGPNTVGANRYFTDNARRRVYEMPNERLTDRKQELRRLLAKTSPPFPVR